MMFRTCCTALPSSVQVNSEKMFIKLRSANIKHRFFLFLSLPSLRVISDFFLDSMFCHALSCQRYHSSFRFFTIYFSVIFGKVSFARQRFEWRKLSRSRIALYCITCACEQSFKVDEKWFLLGLVWHSFSQYRHLCQRFEFLFCIAYPRAHSSSFSGGKSACKSRREVRINRLRRKIKRERKHFFRHSFRFCIFILTHLSNILLACVSEPKCYHLWRWF